jgi:hypothetical protein
MKFMNIAKAALLLALASLLPCRILAWNSPGHMIVAGLAYDELTSDQQQAVVALLKLHPDLAPLMQGFPTGSTPTDRELFMASSVWPDLIKRGHPEYKDIGYEMDKPAVTQVTFDHIQHTGWHFIDLPLWVGTGDAPTNLPPAPEANAVGVINVLIKQLGSDEAVSAKAYDLVWLLHLVGDLHQPLHAVTGITEATPKGDKGGNDVVLLGETNNETELHAYWDDIFAKSSRPDRRTNRPRLDRDLVNASNWIADLKSGDLGPEASNLDPAVWARESLIIAERDVYNFELMQTIGGKKTLKATLDEAYHQTALADAKMRVRLAGHRLALILQSTVAP